MKKLNRILFSILFASLVLPFASCGDDEEDDNNTPFASLPTSVGENPFSGKNHLTTVANSPSITIAAITDTET